MKPVQVMMEEDLLRRFDADEDVKRDGRSAVLRRMIADYLKRRRAAGIAAAYRRAYSGRAPLGRGFEGWTDEGAWPED